MTKTPLTYDSIIPVGTKLRYIGTNSLLNCDASYIVTKQNTHDVTHWLYLMEEKSGIVIKPNGWNPQVFEIVEELPPSEIWTL